MAEIKQLWLLLQSHLTQGVVITLTATSAVMMVASIFLIPMILCKIPSDYFLNEKPHLLTRIKSNNLPKSLLLIIKNLFGLVLLVAGILMLFLPGQGLLTILIGIILIDFPGKFSIERKIVAKPKILAAINWFRTRRGKPKLINPKVR